ncbi:WPP domain-interacting protein 1-like [Olea europaea var. sylvestris]|uniref:WPP domain-interacting protein 1-like n=1 Tax=Olea europaea var. sylvestris TaxID=158386 RepID=UPI000C1D0D02|nr:WPP domain-interacting protein 1-like [Olea europaea var. sylvestris]
MGGPSHPSEVCESPSRWRLGIGWAPHVDDAPTPLKIRGLYLEFELIKEKSCRPIFDSSQSMGEGYLLVHWLWTPLAIPFQKSKINFPTIYLQICIAIQDSFQFPKAPKEKSCRPIFDSSQSMGEGYLLVHWLNQKLIFRPYISKSVLQLRIPSNSLKLPRISGLELGEDNDAISTISGSEKLVNGDETNFQNNGGVVENNYPNELSSKGKGMGTEVRDLVNLAATDVKLEVLPSHATMKKGNRLKKWKRIKRDPNKVGNSSADTGKMVMQDLSNSGGNSSKRMQVLYDRNQKGEGSVSSTNAVARNLDGFAMLGDYGLAIGPTFAAGTDSENSEDRSSKSSTAASAPRARYEMPVVAGFPRDRSKIRSPSGKNLGNTVRGQQGKGRIETGKKAKGERFKIEKENSQSNMKSDSRSSNYALMQGNNTATINGILSGRLMNYDEANGDEVQASELQVRDGIRGGYDRNNDRRFEDVSREDLVADSSWEAKEERSENHENSTDSDPLVESVFALQSAQEALEKEVQKFREIGREDVSVDEVVQDLPSEFTSVDPKLDIELEDLFKQKIEAEVEYLVITRNAQMLRVAAVDLITLLEKQNFRASQQTRMLNELRDTEDVPSATVDSEDVPCAGETLKMRKRVCKYTSCFFTQLLLLVILLGVSIFRSSPNNADIVPT